LKQSEVGTLYDANINSIIKKTTTGVVIWGQKTLQAKTSALSHLNVRRLQIEIEGYIGALSDDLLFQPNTEALKTKFKNLVNPYLKGIQQKEGLVAWQIVMDDTNNSNSDIDNGILRGYILIQPTIAVEYIYLDFQIQKSGVIFGQ
jgi:phage tail sheath protein FI